MFEGEGDYVGKASVNRDDLLYAMLDLGQAMLLAGAEVNRVERRLAQIGRAYGACATNVLVITSSMVITMVFPDGQKVTQTRRIVGEGCVDYRLVERLDSLAVRICVNDFSVDQINEQLALAKAVDADIPWFCLGNVLAACAFSVFFGGGALDALVSAVIALMVTVLQKKVQPYFPNTIVFNVACSFMAGIVICSASFVLPEMAVDKVMIGEVMLLIPGVVMTNAIRDMLMGDTITGSLRGMEALLWAVALACGFMAALALTGASRSVGPGLPEDLMGTVVQVAAAFVGSMGFALIFHLPRRYLLVASVGGMLAWCVYLLLYRNGAGVFLSALAASAFAALWAEILARGFKAPSLLFVIPAVIPLIPGAPLYYTMSFAVQADWATSGSYLLRTLWFALGIAAGMCVTWAVETTLRNLGSSTPSSAVDKG